MACPRSGYLWLGKDRHRPVRNPVRLRKRLLQYEKTYDYGINAAIGVPAPIPIRKLEQDLFRRTTFPAQPQRRPVIRNRPCIVSPL
jgi:hypothetical protein